MLSYLIFSFQQIYDGATTSGLRLHPGEGFSAGSRPRITLTANSGAMLVRFMSDSLHAAAGWKASYSADCPALQAGEGAQASSRDTAFGTVVTFTCPRGHEFATGNNKLVTECLPGGEWSISYIPKCQGTTKNQVFTQIKMLINLILQRFIAVQCLKSTTASRLARPM